MFKTNHKKGLMIFGVLILVFLALSIAAYVISGNMGIKRGLTMPWEFMPIQKKRVHPAYLGLTSKATWYPM